MPAASGLGRMTEQHDHLSQEINTSLKTFIRGLTQANLSESLEGYRLVLEIGSPAVPLIRDAILRSNWSNVKYAEEVRYLSGLVRLLRDIDESEAEEMATHIKRNGCDMGVAHILDAICRFTLADYSQYEIRQIKVFERKRLITKQAVQPKLEKWLKDVPEADLEGIERLYVLRKIDLSASGNYVPILCTINLVWDNPLSRMNPMSALNLFLVKYTLYHEIGHHVRRHTFGRDPVQESEANEYADRMMVASWPGISKITRILRRVVVLSHCRGTKSAAQEYLGRLDNPRG